jgi:chitinase
MQARLRVLVALCLVALMALAVAATAGANDASKAKHATTTQNIAYFIQWGVYGRQYYAYNVQASGQADNLTQIDYAFGNVAPDTGGNIVCSSADPWADYQLQFGYSTWPPSVDGSADSWSDPYDGNFKQLMELKQLHPNLKVLISIGGWSFSKYFSQAAATAAGRQTLVSSCLSTFISNVPWEGLFDGIDVDWEWPGSAGNDGNIVSPADKANYVKLLAEFRKQLDAYGAAHGKHMLLTAFLPAAADKVKAGIDGKIFDSLDYGDLQGYDLHGSWDTQTDHQSNLYQGPKDWSKPKFSVKDTLQAYQAIQAPKQKLVVGVPFYSYGWTGVPSTNNGLYQTSTGPAAGIWAAGQNDYKALVPLLSSGYTRHYDANAGAAWIYSPTDQTFWTFDDPAIMQMKGQFVRDQGLGGIMAWELSGDTSDGSLEAGIASGLWGS